jgi:hypothetical protein
MKICASLLVIGLTLGGVAACNKDEQVKLEQEKREAAEKAANAQREADEEKAKAAKELAEAERKASEARTEARAELQKDIAAIDRKAMSLKESAAKAAGKAKLNAAAATAEFDKRRAVVEADLQRLNTATGEAWQTTKAETEKHVESAKAALDSLDNTLAAKR